MKFRWHLVLIALTLSTLFFSIPGVSAQSTDTVQELKASYLQSIYDDCRIFLEGIELFIRRDYPKFWQNIDEELPIPQNEIDRYSKELKHFEGQLDALFEEYVTFKSNSGNTAKEGTSFSNLELQIYQMLAYSYMKTGDFAMSYDLLQNKNIFSQNFTIKLIDIEGNLKEFPLTLELKKLFKIISGNLNFLTLRLKYFFPSDIQYINAYLNIPDYDHDSPFNKAYFSYYKGAFSGLGEKDENNIHFSEIIHFFNRREFKNVTKGAKISQDNQQYISSYKFPIIKGEYDIELKDNTILAAESLDNNTLNLERLCMFKGFVVTDFKRLKSDERKNIKNDTLISKGLYLEKTDLLSDDNDIMATSKKDTKKRILLDYELSKDNLKIGEMLRYGVYRLFEQGKYLGMIELVPCYKGEDCKKRSIDKSITKVKVYNHELIFYQDILDAVQANRRMFGKGNYSTPSNTKIDLDTPSEATVQADTPSDAPKVHVGRGCSPKR
ncbi:MAG: hypothetical protein KKD44_16140 [Proteobacteria bacterium]|nr:hypothetical protein [Pseudomonadota bacterium]